MMPKWEKWALHLTTTAVGLSGFLFFWMKYLLESDDPFSVLNHPWQSATLNLHLLFSPLLVFLLGMVTRSHVSGKLRNGTRRARRSGLVLLISFPVMVISGYLPTVLTNPAFLEWTLTMHLVSGSVFFGLYLLHFLAGRVKKRRRARQTRGSESKIRLAA